MEAALIYPHQLFRSHPALAANRPVFLIEDPLFFGNDPEWPIRMHVQKLVLHRVSMRAYAAELRALGYSVHRIECPDGSDLDSGALLSQALPSEITCLHLADPEDDVLLRRVKRFAADRSIQLQLHDSPNFLTPMDELDATFGGDGRLSMARFYSSQRIRRRILLEPDGGPVGGKWSFDTENRSKLPKHHHPPAEPMVAPTAEVREAIAWAKNRFPDHLGTAEAFRWPVTRADAERWLDRFIDDRLSGFGTYEDAISTRHATLYHAAITPMLNIGLLDPREVVARVLAKADVVPLNSLEGFIRQVIGWREFMRGVYRHRGVSLRKSNFWNFDRPIPGSFYDGTTGIAPVDRVIRQVLADGYCHHIERLMVLGNFMLLCRFRPDDVYRWFMEMFVDSYDWVMVPNVYGMSQFADGGSFTTKPYLSGSSYVLRMSDETRGPWCAVWDGLFWSFIGDHAEFFLGNPRLSMMAVQWRKQPEATRAAHRKAANAFLESL